MKILEPTFKDYRQNGVCLEKRPVFDIFTLVNVRMGFEISVTAFSLLSVIAGSSDSL